jgi:hypothetical protein
MSDLYHNKRTNFRKEIDSFIIDSLDTKNKDKLFKEFV